MRLQINKEFIQNEIKKSKKYSLESNKIQKNSLCPQKQRINLDLETKMVTEKQDMQKKLDKRKKKNKLMNKLNIGDRVLVLAERLKKKMHLENFVKVQKFSKKSIMTNYF